MQKEKSHLGFGRSTGSATGLFVFGGIRPIYVQARKVNCLQKIISGKEEFWRHFVQCEFARD